MKSLLSRFSRKLFQTLPRYADYSAILMLHSVSIRDVGRIPANQNMVFALKSLTLLAKRKLSPMGENWLNRKDPFFRTYSLDRGAPIDRRFMGDFLSSHQENILGKVLEIGDDQYTYQFGVNLTSTAILTGSENSSRSKCFPLPFYDLTEFHS